MRDTEYLDFLLDHAERLFSNDELLQLTEIPLFGPHGLRRYLAEQNFEFFLKAYFHEELTVPWSAAHNDFITIIQDLHNRFVNNQQGRKAALAIPRGLGKTSLGSRLQPLWRFLIGSSPLTLLVGNNAEAATRLVRNIKQSYEQSEALQQDFPGVAGSIWTTERLQNATNNAVIVGLSRGSGAIRGVSTGRSRVSLGIFDDIDDDASVSSPVESRSAIDWFVKSALPTGDNLTGRTSFVIVGTRIGKQSVLEYALNSSDFEQRIYQGILRFPDDSTAVSRWERWLVEQATQGLAPTSYDDDTYWHEHKAELETGAVVIWPELGASLLYSYLRYRLAHGQDAFASEVQNELSDRSVVSLGEIALVDRSALPTADVWRIAALDPTTSGRASADFPGYVELLLDLNTSVLYVDFAMAERRPYAETIQLVADRIAELPRPLDGLYCETNAAGTIIRDLLQQELATRSRIERVIGVHHKASKHERIAVLGTYARRGQLRVVSDVHEEFRREWAGDSRNDDLLDAAATAILQLKEKNLLDGNLFEIQTDDAAWLVP